MASLKSSDQDPASLHLAILGSCFVQELAEFNDTSFTLPNLMIPVVPFQLVHVDCLCTGVHNINTFPLCRLSINRLHSLNELFLFRAKLLLLELLYSFFHLSG